MYIYLIFNIKKKDILNMQSKFSLIKPAMICTTLIVDSCNIFLFLYCYNTVLFLKHLFLHLHKLKMSLEILFLFIFILKENTEVIRILFSQFQLSRQQLLLKQCFPNYANCWQIFVFLQLRNSLLSHIDKICDCHGRVCV